MLKKIKGNFDYIYAATPQGDIFVFKRKHWHKCNQIRKFGNKGYLFVYLKSGGKFVFRRVHRIIAETFIPNPLKYDEINHLNENKQDNRVENLEWCDTLYNINYGNRKLKEIKVMQFDKNGNFIQSFRSLAEVSRQLNLPNFSKKFRQYIDSGKSGLYYGYVWKENK